MKNKKKKKINKNNKVKKESKKRLIAKENPLGFEINKDLIFNNNSETVIKSILEKIMINVFVTIKVNNIESLMNKFCSHNLIKEINSLLSLSNLCYEKENPNFSEIIFNDNYIRTEPNMEKYDITQPSPAILDRWKIYRMGLVKFTKSKLSKNKDNKLKEEKRNTSRRISKLKSDIRSRKNTDIISRTQRNEYLDVIEKAKMKKEGLKFFDSFPSFPISESVFKQEVNLTKEQEKQIESLRDEILMKEKLKRKEDEKQYNIGLLKSNSQKEKEYKKEKELEEKKYRGKTIGITANGEIIFIKSINVKDLKSEFMEVTSHMNNEIEKKVSTKIKNKSNLDLKVKEIEKNKINEEQIDYYRENNKDRINKQIIIGGSSFSNFVPETGVNIKQGIEVKSGGNDFTNKYKKISFNQFEKKSEIFNKSNKENNIFSQIKKENEILSPNKDNNYKNNEKINNINNNVNQLLDTHLQKRRNSNQVLSFRMNINKKTIERSSSLPDLYTPKINSKNNFESIINEYNTNNNDDLMVKNSFNFTNYNNSYHNSNSSYGIINSKKYYSNINNYSHINHLIKTSSSFKEILFNDKVITNDNIKENIQNKFTNNISTTSRNFFSNFKRNFKILSKPKRSFYSLRKIQNFNNDIVNDKNWGTISNDNVINHIHKIPNINAAKNSSYENKFRVRTNVNEIILKKMNMADTLSFRKIGSEIQDIKKFNEKAKIKKIKV